MIDSAPLPRHPLGIQYLLLCLGAWLIRLPAMIAMRLNEKKISAVLDGSGVSRTRIRVPSRQKGRGINVDLYERVGGAEGKKQERRFVHVNFHGSGFVIPSLGSDVEFCTQLARTTGTVVFDADYRKAPEHPFPAAFQDAQDVLAYIHNHASDFDVDHLTIGGFSAGANLAMATAVNSPPGWITGLISMYGNTDMTKVYPAPGGRNYDSGVVLPEWLRRFFYRCLILPGQGKDDTRLSPTYASLHRWPAHCFLACGTADSLHEAGEVLVRKLKKGKHGDAEFLSVEREAHAFDKQPKGGSQTEVRTKEAYRRAVEMVDRAHQ